MKFNCFELTVFIQSNYLTSTLMMLTQLTTSRKIDNSRQKSQFEIKIDACLKYNQKLKIQFNN